MKKAGGEYETEMVRTPSLQLADVNSAGFLHDKRLRERKYSGCHHRHVYGCAVVRREVYSDTKDAYLKTRYHTKEPGCRSNERCAAWRINRVRRSRSGGRCKLIDGLRIGRPGSTTTTEGLMKFISLSNGGNRS